MCGLGIGIDNRVQGLGIEFRAAEDWNSRFDEGFRRAWRREGLSDVKPMKNSGFTGLDRRVSGRD